MSKRRGYYTEDTTTQKIAEVFFYLVIPAMLLLGTVALAIAVKVYGF